MTLARGGGRYDGQLSGFTEQLRLPNDSDSTCGLDLERIIGVQRTPRRPTWTGGMI